MYGFMKKVIDEFRQVDVITIHGLSSIPVIKCFINICWLNTDVIFHIFL